MTHDGKWGGPQSLLLSLQLLLQELSVCPLGVGGWSMQRVGGKRRVHGPSPTPTCGEAGAETGLQAYRCGCDSPCLLLGRYFLRRSATQHKPVGYALQPCMLNKDTPAKYGMYVTTRSRLQCSMVTASPQNWFWSGSLTLGTDWREVLPAVHVRCQTRAQRVLLAGTHRRVRSDAPSILPKGRSMQ